MAVTTTNGNARTMRDEVGGAPTGARDTGDVIGSNSERRQGSRRARRRVTQTNSGDRGGRRSRSRWAETGISCCMTRAADAAATKSGAGEVVGSAAAIPVMRVQHRLGHDSGSEHGSSPDSSPDSLELSGRGAWSARSRAEASGHALQHEAVVEVAIVTTVSSGAAEQSVLHAHTGGANAIVAWLSRVTIRSQRMWRRRFGTLVVYGIL